MMKDWLLYQKIAAEIYAELDPNAVVKHDDRIRGNQTGLLRQIDVSIRAQIAGHPLLIIVQAKDHANPANVNIVGEFKAVLEDVGANKGVLICSSGFTEKAHTYAKSLNIDLCRLVDTQRAKWALGLTIPLVWVDNPVDVRAELEVRPDRNNEEDITLKPPVAAWAVTTSSGSTRRTLGDLVAGIWNDKKVSHEPYKWHDYSISDPTSRLLLGDKDFWCPFTMKLRYFCRRTGWLGSFTMKQLRGILNYSESKLKVRVSISPKDLPQTRSLEWKQLEDPDRFIEQQPNVIILNFAELDPKTVNLDELFDARVL